MILVDSSAWIEFLRPGGVPSVRRAVGRALASDTVLTLPLIVAEVVQGAPDEETLQELAEDFSALEWVSMGGDTALTAARLGYALRRSDRPVPVTDLLIAAGALQADAVLWHLDSHFETIARVAPLKQKRF